MTVIIYTDGACKHDPVRTGLWAPGEVRYPSRDQAPPLEPLGKGGWAWYHSDEFWGSGAVKDTTNNQMEMLAVVRALEAARVSWPTERLLIVSDSAYVVNCFADRWYVKWEKNGWVNFTKQPVKNRDLWQQMVGLYRDHGNSITFRHCRGHGRGGPGDAPYVEGNKRADKLAVAARLTLERP